VTANSIDDGFMCAYTRKAGGDRGLTKIEATEKDKLKDGIRHGVEAKY